MFTLGSHKEGKHHDPEEIELENDKMAELRGLAFEDGTKAFLQGVKYNECPYDYEEQFDQNDSWSDGWRNCKADQDWNEYLNSKKA